MSTRVSFLALTALASGLAAAPAAALGSPWLTQAETRTMIVGHAMKGYYRNAERWVDDYAADGGIKYSDARNSWTGRWSFQGDVFCTFYNGGVDGGCYLMRQISANCYEYVIVDSAYSGSELPKGRSPEWFARGWRGAEPSTCEEPMTS
jgi:hypothetical protein